MKKQVLNSRERGQSIVLIAIAITALILIVGLAVDASNAYAAQRKAQSTANSAAIAGTKRLAMTRDNPGSFTDWDIKAEIDNIAIVNGFDPTAVLAEYLDADGDVIGLVGGANGGDVPPPANAVYIRVRIDTSVNTYFVRLAGFTEVDVNAATQAQNISTGAPGCTNGIYPIAVRNQGFQTGEIYWIWDGDPNDIQFPGNFGWLRWRDEPGFGNVDTLVEALTYPGTYGDPDLGYFDGEHHVLSPGRVMFGNSGLSNAQSVRDRLDWFIGSQESLILPLWVEGEGQGSNMIYINSGFAVFRLNQVCFNSNPNQCPGVPSDVPPNAKSIKVTFVGYSNAGCSVAIPVDPGSGGGNQGYATAQGSVYVCNTEAVILPPDEGAHLPVDLVHLIDTSGSMGNPLVGGSRSKIAIEKDALIYFNDLMRPDLGDRLGGVQFHNMNPNVEVLSYLTHDIGYLNGRIAPLSSGGYTPWAQAVLVGTETLFGPGRNPDNKPVMIIASDGAPTVDLDNEYNTNYQLLEWNEMSPGTLLYCYLKNSCANYPSKCQAPVNGCPGPRKQDTGVEVLIDALDAADVVKGITAPADTYWALRHGGCTGGNYCPFYGVESHPEMEIFVIAIKGQSEFSGSVLRYVATDPDDEHYFEVYQESDVLDIYTYIANAISGQLPYCYLDSQPIPYGGNVDLMVMAGGAVVSTGSGSNGGYTVPNIPIDPYEGYIISGTLTIDNMNYGVASSCGGGVLGMEATQPQIYEKDVFFTPQGEGSAECPEGTIVIPPP